MATISEKYIAGLIDSDGYVGCINLKKGTRPTIFVNISQRTDRSSVLDRLKEQFGGFIQIDRRNPLPCSHWRLQGKLAKMLLFRVVKYLVIKKDYVKWFLDEIEHKQLEMETTEFNKLRKEKRNQRIGVTPNYPTRKWLAGYFDGDGCVRVNTLSKDNQAYISFSIVAHNHDTVGLEIIKKNFGGSFSKSTGKDCTLWTLYITKSNIGSSRKFLDYFWKHSIIKHDQLLAVIEYLNSSDKDGQRLKSTLEQLKRPAQTK